MAELYGEIHLPLENVDRHGCKTDKFSQEVNGLERHSADSRTFLPFCRTYDKKAFTQRH